MSETEVKTEGDLLDESKDTRRIYEVGYHLVPTLAEEQLGAKVEELHSLIANEKGVIISEEAPKLRELAYILPKVVGGQKYNFQKAYFGWIKFEADASSAKVIEEALKAKEHILRFLLIKTVRESTLVGLPKAPVKAEGKDSEKTEDGAKAPSQSSEADLDKTIESLLG